MHDFFFVMCIFPKLFKTPCMLVLKFHFFHIVGMNVAVKTLASNMGVS